MIFSLFVDLFICHWQEKLTVTHLTWVREPLVSNLSRDTGNDFAVFLRPSSITALPGHSS
jgi:hypothetical protein